MAGVAFISNERVSKSSGPRGWIGPTDPPLFPSILDLAPAPASLGPVACGANPRVARTGTMCNAVQSGTYSIDSSLAGGGAMMPTAARLPHMAPALGTVLHIAPAQASLGPTVHAVLAATTCSTGSGLAGAGVVYGAGMHYMWCSLARAGSTALALVSLGSMLHFPSWTVLQVEPVPATPGSALHMFTCAAQS